MKKTSIGFLLINIDNSAHIDNILKQIKFLIDNNPYSDIVVFNSNCDKIDTYNIPILHLSHAKFFDGYLWLFDLMGIIISKNFTNLKKKILYTNDMPWVKNRDVPYKEWQSLYGKDMDFMVSSQPLYDIYSICWKKPIDFMENFSYEKIQDTVQQLV